MANFPTHIGIGTLACGALATLTLAADVVAPENLVAVTVAGVLGSILPDIDLKDSRPSKAMFSGLAAFFSFIVLFVGADKLSIAELWLLAMGTFLFVRYVAHFIFHRMSYHRGIYHSILAGVFFAFFTAAVYKHLLGRHEGVAWLAAGFMFIGYLVHLLLDEIYSVDVMDTRIKASFGTAMKLFDYRKLGHSAAMAAATAGLFMLTPPTTTFTKGISDKSLWVGLQQRMLPKDRWFGIIVDPLRQVNRATAATTPASVPAIAATTSSPAVSVPAVPAVAASVTEAVPSGAAAVSPIETGSIALAPKTGE